MFQACQILMIRKPMNGKITAQMIMGVMSTTTQGPLGPNAILKESLTALLNRTQDLPGRVALRALRAYDEAMETKDTKLNRMINNPQLTRIISMNRPRVTLNPRSVIFLLFGSVFSSPISVGCIKELLYKTVKLFNTAHNRVFIVVHRILRFQ